jgi:hypothetical protein
MVKMEKKPKKKAIRVCEESERKPAELERRGALQDGL